MYLGKGRWRGREECIRMRNGGWRGREGKGGGGDGYNL